MAFAATFHFAFLSLTHAARPVFEDGPARYASRWVDPWNRAAREASGREFPELVGPAEATAPAWMEPFWAGLAAALGQCVCVAAWLTGPTPAPRRRKLWSRYARTQSLVWVGLAPLVFVKLGELYMAVPYDGMIWLSAFGEPAIEDPFGGLGWVALLAVLFLALEPWRALQVRHRCGWQPVAGVVVVAVVAGLLFVSGRLALAGAA